MSVVLISCCISSLVSFLQLTAVCTSRPRMLPVFIFSLPHVFACFYQKLSIAYAAAAPLLAEGFLKYFPVLFSFGFFLSEKRLELPEHYECKLFDVMIQLSPNRHRQRLCSDLQAIGVRAATIHRISVSLIHVQIILSSDADPALERALQRLLKVYMVIAFLASLFFVHISKQVTQNDVALTENCVDEQMLDLLRNRTYNILPCNPAFFANSPELTFRELQELQLRIAEDDRYMSDVISHGSY